MQQTEMFAITINRINNMFVIIQYHLIIIATNIIKISKHFIVQVIKSDVDYLNFVLILELRLCFIAQMFDA